MFYNLLYIIAEWGRLLTSSGGRIAGVAALASAVALGATAPAAATMVPAADVIGAGWSAWVTCVGCIAGGTLILAGGAGAILAALYYPGGALIAAGCVVSCVNAVS